jgi:tetratricopeptide (TPR) repeat protein
MDHLLYAAIEADRLPPIKLLNRAFTHARSAEDMMTAYYAATRVVIFLVDEFGFDKIVAMLREWSKDRSTPEVVERALGLDIDTLDERYRRYEGERLKSQARQFRVDFARYTDVEPLEKTASASPDDAGAQAAYAAGLLVRGKREDAARVAKRALELDPDEPLAHFLLGRMAIAQRNAEVAQRHLTALLRGGHDGYDVRMLLARLAFARRDPDAARQQLVKAARLDPERTEAWVGLARVGKAKEDRALQIRALSKVVELEEHDRSALRALLGLLVEAERWSAIADLAPTVGFLDPFNADAHAHVGRALLKQGEPLAALYEYETALAAKPQAPGPVHLGRARALVALGRRDAAKEAATAAVEADESLAAEAEAALAP